MIDDLDCYEQRLYGDYITCYRIAVKLSLIESNNFIICSDVAIIFFNEKKNGTRSLLRMTIVPMIHEQLFFTKLKVRTRLKLELNTKLFCKLKSMSDV